jgi:hypothetical protein
MCPLDALLLDAAYCKEKADDEHGSDNREDKGEVGKVGCNAKGVASDNRRRTNPAEVIEVPKSGTAQGRQLKETIPWVAQVELVNSKDAEEEGQHKRSHLRLARGLALGIGPIAVALTE